MGCRGNIGVRSVDGTVWFYTHGMGDSLAAVCRAALSHKERWYDPPYLARIVFNELQKDDPPTTGCGIATEPGDNSYPFLIVDTVKQAVYQEADTRDSFGILPKKEADLIPIPFAEFIKQKES